MLAFHNIMGHWQGSGSELLQDYVAGLLVTRNDSGATTRGAPEEFISVDGESGVDVLARFLVPPTLAELSVGVRRECLAAAHCVSVFGSCETRALDGLDYIVDSGEGSCAAVRFARESCVGAMINYDPWREYSPSLMADMPETLRKLAHEVCALPFLSSPDQKRITAIFWSGGGRLAAGEPWYRAYKFGAELFRREFLDDEMWVGEAAEYYGVEEHLLHLIAGIARRTPTLLERPIITSSELGLIVPQNSQNPAPARELIAAVVGIA